MKSLFCKHGDTTRGEVTITLQRGETTVVVKKAPAEVCRACGEHYLSDLVTERVLEMAGTAGRNGAEVEIARFVA